MTDVEDAARTQRAREERDRLRRGIDDIRININADLERVIRVKRQRRLDEIAIEMQALRDEAEELNNIK